ncbi:DUF4272 domain-containing protein [Burkholderia cenocepacia]|nr:DUF4272 domain-containing protein [Burkholderia cenocepacia]HDR9869926.1 DUF4272 domain-containing protein [Burkholderia cenocepacia]HEM8998796.1 DUF4272 domain-containing protein [Burkholderia cenocepacia]
MPYYLQIDPTGDFHMQASVIRDHSIVQARRLGYSRTPPLPLLDCDLLEPRPQQEVEKRALALSVVVAISYGLDRASGRAWLEREGLYGALSAAEGSFVEDARSAGGSPFQAQVEALGIFAWALGHAPTLQFDQALPSNLVKFIPTSATRSHFNGSSLAAAYVQGTI